LKKTLAMLFALVFVFALISCENGKKESLLIPSDKITYSEPLSNEEKSKVLDTALDALIKNYPKVKNVLPHMRVHMLNFISDHNEVTVQFFFEPHGLGTEETYSVKMTGEYKIKEVKGKNYGKFIKFLSIVPEEKFKEVKESVQIGEDKVEGNFYLTISDKGELVLNADYVVYVDTPYEDREACRDHDHYHESIVVWPPIDKN